MRVARAPADNRAWFRELASLPARTAARSRAGSRRSPTSVSRSRVSPRGSPRSASTRGFWGLTFNRLLGVALGQAPEGEELLLVRRGWAAHALFYLLAVFLTTPFPVPRLGLTPEIVAGLGLSGGGLWVEHPEHLLAAGVIYFTAVAISGARGHRWIRERDLGDLRSDRARAA